MHYPTGTEELFFVQWEDEADSPPSVTGALLDRPLAQLYTEARLLGQMRKLMFFDACRKKMSRPSAITRVGRGIMRWEPRRPKTIWSVPVRRRENIRAAPLAVGASRSVGSETRVNNVIEIRFLNRYCDVWAKALLVLCEHPLKIDAAAVP